MKEGEFQFLLADGDLNQPGLKATEMSRSMIERQRMQRQKEQQKQERIEQAEELQYFGEVVLTIHCDVPFYNS